MSPVMYKELAIDPTLESFIFAELVEKTKAEIQANLKDLKHLSPDTKHTPDLWLVVSAPTKASSAEASELLEQAEVPQEGSQTLKIGVTELMPEIVDYLNHPSLVSLFKHNVRNILVPTTEVAKQVQGHSGMGPTSALFRQVEVKTHQEGKAQETAWACFFYSLNGTKAVILHPSEDKSTLTFSTLSQDNQTFKDYWFDAQERLLFGQDGEIPLHPLVFQLVHQDAHPLGVAVLKQIKQFEVVAAVTLELERQGKLAEIGARYTPQASSFDPARIQFMAAEGLIENCLRAGTVSAKEFSKTAQNRAVLQYLKDLPKIVEELEGKHSPEA